MQTFKFEEVKVFLSYIIFCLQEFQGATQPLFQACRLDFLARTQGLTSCASHAVHVGALVAHFPYIIAPAVDCLTTLTMVALRS